MYQALCLPFPTREKYGSERLIDLSQVTQLTETPGPASGKSCGVSTFQYLPPAHAAGEDQHQIPNFQTKTRFTLQLHSVTRGKLLQQETDGERSTPQRTIEFYAAKENNVGEGVQETLERQTNKNPNSIHR